MAAVVVDASVALKWVVPEEFSEQAVALLAHQAHQPLVGPPALLSEVTNTLYQRTRRRDEATRLTPREAEQALAQILAIGIQIVSPDDVYEQAFAFARAHGLPDVYDTLYVVLAEMLGTDFWTDDRKLLQAVRSAAPWVRWIKDYPTP